MKEPSPPVPVTPASCRFARFWPVCPTCNRALAWNGRLGWRCRGCRLFATIDLQPGCDRTGGIGSRVPEPTVEAAAMPALTGQLEWIIPGANDLPLCPACRSRLRCEARRPVWWCHCGVLALLRRLAPGAGDPRETHAETVRRHDFFIGFRRVRRRSLESYMEHEPDDDPDDEAPPKGSS